MSTVDTESILSSTVSSVSSVVQNAVKTDKGIGGFDDIVNKVKDFVNSSKFKLLLLVLGLVLLTIVKNKLTKTLSKSSEKQDDNKESLNEKTNEDKQNDENYKIVIDDQGNPVLLSMEDIKKIEERLQNEVDQMENRKHQQVPQQVQQQVVQEVPQQVVQQVPQQVVQQVPQQVVQQVPQQVVQQVPQPVVQQVPQPVVQEVEPEIESQPVTVESMNNLLSEESDLEEDLNLNEQDLTQAEMDAIDIELKNI